MVSQGLRKKVVALSEKDGLLTGHIFHSYGSTMNFGSVVMLGFNLRYQYRSLSLCLTGTAGTYREGALACER